MYVHLNQPNYFKLNWTMENHQYHYQLLNYRFPEQIPKFRQLLSIVVIIR